MIIMEIMVPTRNLMKEYLRNLIKEYLCYIIPRVDKVINWNEYLYTEDFILCFWVFYMCFTYSSKVS